jgi:hypothetical protein
MTEFIMSVKVMALVFAAKLNSTEKLVLLSLADHGNDDGLSIYPSIKKTSLRTGLSESAVRKTQRKLEKIGVLMITEYGGGQSNKTNHYKINLEKIAELTPVPRTPLDDVHPTPVPRTPESLFNHNLLNVIEPQCISPSAKPKKPAKSKQSDPRLNHAAIKIFLGITGRYPRKPNFDNVIAILGERPEIEKAAACWQEWNSRGYNQSSIKWLDWYQNGIPQQNWVKNKSQTGGNAERLSKNYDVIEKWSNQE